MFRSNIAYGVSQELLTTPSTIFSRLIADIQRARDTIDVEFYIFASDRTGHAFSELLRRKSRQGVRVRLLVDGFGSRRMSRAMRARMAADGVVVQVYGGFSNCRNHRKMTIIDGHTAHLGGVNIADRYVVGNRLGIWHDVQLRFTGGGVASLASLFDYDYMLCEGLSVEIPIATPHDDIGLCWSECNSGEAMSRLLESVVMDARRSIIFTTPYFIPSQRMLNLLSSAVDRGVSVRVILPLRCDVWAIEDATRGYLREAMQRGIEVMVTRTAFVHAKMAFVDGRRVVLGSANLDPRSLHVNRELMASTTASNVCLAADDFIRRLLMISSPPTPRELRNIIPAGVVRLFEPIL